MKAIKITQELKDNNSKLFGNMEVGKIYPFNPPKVFNRKEVIEVKEIVEDEEVIKEKSMLMQVHGYKDRDDLHFDDGFKELIRPSITETQKHGEIEKVGNQFVYSVIDKTKEELFNEIPKTISKLAFKTALLNLDNPITNNDVNQVLETIDDSVQKERLRLMWYEADFFEIDNPYLYQFAQPFGLSETDIHNIFKSQGNA